MQSRLEPILKTLAKKYKAEIGEFRDNYRVKIPSDKIVDILKFLKKEKDFTLLSTMTAVDFWPENHPRFQVLYQLTCTRDNLSLSLLVDISGGDPNLPTVTGVFRNANWREREIWDLFGINFVGHPDMRRLLMPADWEGHPLRKDYPLGYEEPQFTFNYDEIDVRKPYAKE